MHLAVPDELWGPIADLANSESLSQVCRRLRELLGSHRYVKVTCNPDQVVDKITPIAGSVRTLQLEVRHGWDSTCTLAVLRTAPHLQMLCVDIEDFCLNFSAGPSGTNFESFCEGLAALKENPLLHTLALNLPLRLHMGCLQSLAVLKHVPVRTLALSFQRRALEPLGIPVGAHVVHTLAALEDAPSLQNLSLDLGATAVEAKGAEALAAIRHAPLLRTIRLNLSHNALGNRGARAVARLKDAPGLHTVFLNLTSNAIGPSGAEALAGFRHAPSLRSLTLNLSENAIGDSGAQALAALRDGSLLQTLTLDLGNNAVGATGAQTLALLKDSAISCRIHIHGVQFCG